MEFLLKFKWNSEGVSNERPRGFWMKLSKNSNSNLKRNSNKFCKRIQMEFRKDSEWVIRTISREDFEWKTERTPNKTQRSSRMEEEKRKSRDLEYISNRKHKTSLNGIQRWFRTESGGDYVWNLEKQSFELFSTRISNETQMKFQMKIEWDLD